MPARVKAKIAYRGGADAVACVNNVWGNVWSCDLEPSTNYKQTIGNIGLSGALTKRRHSGRLLFEMGVVENAGSDARLEDGRLHYTAPVSLLPMLVNAPPMVVASPDIAVVAPSPINAATSAYSIRS
jgi:hypothetical protein